MASSLLAIQSVRGAVQPAGRGAAAAVLYWAAVLAALLIGAGPRPAAAQPANNDGAALASTTVAHVFTCGVGFTSTTVGISNHGNVLRFESPAGSEHILVGTPASGYQVCYSTGGPFATAYDFAGHGESGWGATVTASQPNGPGTFPLDITRTTADGRLTVQRRFMGTSFGTPGGPFDLNGDGASCSTLSECGNCSNRTIHIVTTVFNNSPATASVRYVEFADFDIAGTPGDDRWAKTDDSVIAWEDLDDASASGASRGMLLQSLVLPAITAVTISPEATTDCSFSSAVSTPFVGDGAARLRQDIILGPFSNSGNSLRVHYRRF